MTRIRAREANLGHCDCDTFAPGYQNATHIEPRIFTDEHGFIGVYPRNLRLKITTKS